MAGDAAFGPKVDFGLERNPLRVMAPGTVQRAAFQENRGADPRPVVDGEPLYVKNSPR